MLCANVAAKLATRAGPKPLLMTGMAALATSSLLLTRIDTTGSYLGVVLPAILVMAIGLGAGFVAGSIAVTTGVAEDDQGLAAGLFNTAQQIGSAVGLAVLVTVASATTANPADPEAVVTGDRWALVGAAALSLAALVLVAVGIRTRPADDPCAPPASEQVAG